MNYSNAFKVALIGNPNCGKTSIFNRLTGENQRVGNWSGVTVSKKIGQLISSDGAFELIDLPGIYAILKDTSESGIDEKLTCDYLQSQQPHCILNIVDAANLERNLYLTVQLLEKGHPMMIIINRMDLLEKSGQTLDCDALSKALGCRVFAMSSEIERLCNKKRIVDFKKELLEGVQSASISHFKVHYPKEIEENLDPNKSRLEALAFLEQEAQDADIVIAQTRYQKIEQILARVLSKRCPSKRQQWKSQIDHFFLHRLFGLPIFLSVMYALFIFAINVGGAFQDFFDISSHAIFVEGLANLLLQYHTPAWLVAILASGLGKGINTLVTFIPVIGAMFLALTFLEESGYMARAAFVIDRLMQAFGLPGKSFVPMIVGFGCNVPAIMGARTLEKKRDRILTVVMSPFMSCGARLAIFTLFVAAFFPEGGQNIVFLLYLIGISMAVLTGLLLKKTLLRGAPSSMVLELPLFRIPRLKNILPQAVKRLTRFIKNAAGVILPVCILIGALNSVSMTGQFISEKEAHPHSVLASIGKTLTPLFEPMGIQSENWPATVGLFSGLLAKELVVGTLNSLYTENPHQATEVEPAFDLKASLKEAVYSIPHNLIELGGAFKNPLGAHTDLSEITDQDRVYGAMIARFDGKVGAFAYLLFVLLYFPCVSVTAAMLKEVDKKWTLFSVLWTTGIAYAAAVLFYQVATFTEHPKYSLFWITLIIGLVLLVILTLNQLRFKINRELPTRIVLS